MTENNFKISCSKCTSLSTIIWVKAEITKGLQMWMSFGLLNRFKSHF